MKRIILGLAGVLAAVFILFEVDFIPRFRLPATESMPDPAQEARFDECVLAAESEFHEELFAEVDNPDVQRELIFRFGQEARATCREEHPEKMIEVETPLDVNLVDLSWRF